MASIADVLTGLGQVGPWFWGRFTDLIDLIANNSILLVAVIFAIVAGVIGVILKVVRKFGIKGRR